MKNKKKRISHLILIGSAMLFIIMYFLGRNNYPIFLKSFLFILSLSICLWIFFSLNNKWISSGNGIIYKKKNPKLFWAIIIFLILSAGVSFILGLLELLNIIN
jgi:hypothetical protein